MIKLDCLHYSEIIAFYNHTIEKDKKNFVDHHLQDCERCRKRLETYKNFRRTLSKSISYKNTEQCFDDFQLVQFLESKKLKVHHDYLIHFNQCDSCRSRFISFRNMVDELKNDGMIPTYESQWIRIFRSTRTTVIKRLEGIWNIILARRPIYRFVGVAIILIFVSVMIWQPLTNDKIPFTSRESETEGQIILLSPQNRSEVNKNSQIQFVWKGNDNIISYGFRLLNSNGEIILAEKTSQTELILPNEIALESSMTYHWQVEGLLEFGTSVLSDMVHFTCK